MIAVVIVFVVAILGLGLLSWYVLMYRTVGSWSNIKQYLVAVSRLKRSASRWPKSSHTYQIVRKTVGHDTDKLVTYSEYLDDLYDQLQSSKALFILGPRSEEYPEGANPLFEYEIGLLEGEQLLIDSWLAQIDAIKQTGKDFKIMFQPGRVKGTVHYSGWPAEGNADSWDTTDSRVEASVKILAV